MNSILYSSRVNNFNQSNYILWPSCHEFCTTTAKLTNQQQQVKKERKKEKESSSSSPATIVNNNENSQLSGHVKVAERIKQTSKDVTYISIILVGIGITSYVFYAVFKEFFSSKSPSSVFGNALAKCKQDPRVVEALGEPIKGHGEITSRRRARHVSFVEYENNSKTYIRVKFYLKGSKGTATVECETDKASSKSHFRYLFVQLDNYPNQVFIIEDNRLVDSMLNN